MAWLTEDGIRAWIQNPPASYHDVSENASRAPAERLPQHAEKRKAEQLTPPLTPNSMSGLDETPPRKRARQTVMMADADLTPRPPRRLVRSPSTSSNSQASAHSRSSSPLKRQIMALRLDESGVMLRQLQIDEPPTPAAAELFSVLRDIGNGIEILPDEVKTSITEGLSIEGPNARAWRYAFSSGALRGLPGRIPRPDEIILVREWAKKCHEALHEEAGWGEEVHHRLLEAVFRPTSAIKGDQKTGGRFDFTSCQSARPHQRWLPQSGKASMVDKCIYHDTCGDADSLRALQELSRHTPTLTVNHTDFTPLQLQIIVASIEVKKRGGKPDAKLQMGTWHAAQWACLRWGVLASLQRSRGSEDPSVLERLADENLSRLPFLVGIVIEGHSWAFTISTQQGPKTTHWEDHRFGTTENYLDICKVVAGLRHITAYAQDVYVPWFQKYILGGFSNDAT